MGDGNPYIEQFAAAVIFKVKHALAMDASALIEGLCTGKYQGFLEEAEIEIFLYPDPKKKAEGDEIFQFLTEVVAVMAFVPGGVEMFGVHFEVANGELSTTYQA